MMTDDVDREAEAAWAEYNSPRARRGAIERWWKTQEVHHPGLGLEELFAKRESKAHAAGYRARAAEQAKPRHFPVTDDALDG